MSQKESKKMINIICRTEGSGIRLITNEEDPTYTPSMLGVFSSTPPTPTAITMKFYSAWWYFLRQVQGISIDELLRADFSPARFRLYDFEGIVTPLVRIRIDRVTGTKNGEWQEWVFSGQFKIELDGLAFIDLTFANEVNDFAFTRPAVVSFFRALNDGFVQVGGGRSIGRGIIQIENLNEIITSIEAMPLPLAPRGRCLKGHFTPKSTASFGGKCRCEAKINPIWVKIPPGYYLGGE